MLQRYNISSNDYAQEFNAQTYFPNQHFEEDPLIQVHPKLSLRLAADSAQLGRVFQDRTHIFQIRPRPSALPSDATLMNVGVRGRRGNIVQTFPSVEYDFVPNQLSLGKGAFVHVQWDGSNSQPKNQAGEGQDQTDRSNMVPMGLGNWNIPHGTLFQKYSGEFSVAGKVYLYKYDIESTYNRDDAIQFCSRYQMMLPEPSSSAMMAEISKLWKNERGKFLGMIFLGLSDEAEEGKFVWDSTNQTPEYTNWRRRRGPQEGEHLNYVALARDFKWVLVPGGRITRFASVLCIREKNENPLLGNTSSAPRQSTLFSGANWIWSSLTEDRQILSDNTNLALQMAASGYVTCEKSADCGAESAETKEPLNPKLNNAPASFLGNIFRPGTGKHFYMSTRNNQFSNRNQKGFIQV